MKDSGWALEVMANLEKAKQGGIESAAKLAFDDFLATLVRTNNDEFREDLKKNHGAIEICQRHKLKDFAAAISKVETKK